MKLLLDTHAFLWFIMGDARLSGAAKSWIEDLNNDCLLSAASLWEAAIKVNLGRLNFTEPFDVVIPRELTVNRICILPIAVGHLSTLVGLPRHHKDPFDRLLAAQCLTEQIPLVSSDAAFDAYGVQRRF